MADWSSLLLYLPALIASCGQLVVLGPPVTGVLSTAKLTAPHFLHPAPPPPPLSHPTTFLAPCVVGASIHPSRGCAPLTPTNDQMHGLLVSRGFVRRADAPDLAEVKEKEAAADAAAEEKRKERAEAAAKRRLEKGSANDDRVNREGAKVRKTKLCSNRCWGVFFLLVGLALEGT